MDLRKEIVMPKFTIEYRAEVEASNAKEAQENFHELITKFNNGYDINEDLNKGEFFDFNVGSSNYAEDGY